PGRGTGGAGAPAGPGARRLPRLLGSSGAARRGMSWSGLAANVAFSAVVLAALLLALWAIAVGRRDVSIIDIFWGPGFAVVGLVTLGLGSGPPGRRILLAVLTAVWGGRLGLYLWWRNRG